MSSTSGEMRSAGALASDYIERARELGPELDAAAEEIELRRELPEPIVEGLVERGLFRLLLPRALGGAELLDAFVELARDKIPRGVKRTLRDNNVVQAQVAQSEARLRAARALLLGSLEQIWRDIAQSGRLTLDHNTTIRLASTWAIHQARDVVDTAYHAAGATAIFESNPFERRFRDIHTVIQQYQGRQAHFETVGQVLLGLQAEGTMFTF
jgi:alkylation response protein AidB-like acyl-CoA dehydrogenase